LYEKVFIKINKSSITVNTKCIVSGDTILFYGQKIHLPGTYQHIVNIGKKCDSIYRLNMDTVVPSERTLPMVSSCQRYTYKGVEYQESTTIIDTLRSIFNCDSLYQKIPLKLYKTSNLKPIEVNACDSFQIGNQIFYKDTNFIVNIPFRQIANCDSQVITYQIKINETIPNQIIASSKPPYYIGDKITLSAALSANSYLWNYKNDTNKSISIIAETASWYKLTTLNLDLCSYSDSIFINPQERDPFFSLPTAFSPNGDFRNDVYRPQRQKDISWISMTIFNRLGEMVYKYYGDFPSWDGIYKDEPQPEGVYLVIFEYFQNGQLKTYRSNLNLFR
jgi:gliding motility-associated-like protein